jgi:hypothetical protein
MDSLPKHDSVNTFAKLFVYPPKNAWNAVLTQLLCWSFRRFCVDRLTTDLSGESGLWETHFNLVSDFAPPEFAPHLDTWLAPENLVHVGNLSQLDATFRELVAGLDKAVEAEDDGLQDTLATLLDEDIGRLLERWLGPVYAPYSIFPAPDEPDENINMTKLNAVNFLLGRQLLLSKMINRRITHRAKPIIRAATPIKTRRNKQNVHVRFSPETRINDARGGGSQNNESEREERGGDQDSHSEAERDGQGEEHASDAKGDQEHP